jgi:hypothetical protein
MAWVGDELWFVNTIVSRLCTLHDNFSFVPRWKPPFITGLAAEDRCHLNGLGLADGQPRYVTFMAPTDEARGWRPHKATAGCLMDLATNEIVARGFATPHSPRVANGLSTLTVEASLEANPSPDSLSSFKALRMPPIAWLRAVLGLMMRSVGDARTARATLAGVEGWVPTAIRLSFPTISALIVASPFPERTP